MRDWFESLEARERLFVVLGAGVVSIALLWGLIWVPLGVDCFIVEWPE